MLDVELWINDTVELPEYAGAVRDGRLDGLTLLYVPPTALPQLLRVGSRASGNQAAVHGARLAAHLDALHHSGDAQRRCHGGSGDNNADAVTDFWTYFERHRNVVFRWGSTVLFTPRIALLGLWFFHTDEWQQVIRREALSTLARRREARAAQTRAATGDALAWLLPAECGGLDTEGTGTFVPTYCRAHPAFWTSLISPGGGGDPGEELPLRLDVATEASSGSVNWRNALFALLCMVAPNALLSYLSCFYLSVNPLVFIPLVIGFAVVQLREASGVLHCLRDAGRRSRHEGVAVSVRRIAVAMFMHVAAPSDAPSSDGPSKPPSILSLALIYGVAVIATVLSWVLPSTLSTMVVGLLLLHCWLIAASATFFAFMQALAWVKARIGAGRRTGESTSTSSAAAPDSSSSSSRSGART